jgi:archaellum component FlaF (FlaF/FlaG flagellin family)
VPPPAQRRRTGRTLLIIGVILILLIVVLAGAAIGANASLSATYNPQRAITDYLAAQKRGDVGFMVANANFLKGDGSYSQYFDRGGLSAMLAYPQNTDITNVKVASSTVVDSNTQTVHVTMTWAGHQVVQAFTMHKDLARVHYNFFYSWRVDIPFTSIHVTLPNQPGHIAVDGLTLPQGALSDIQVMQGFHKVTMSATDLSDAASADADGIAGSPIVVFPTKISAGALAAAKSTIKGSFPMCNAGTYRDCLNHTYYAPNKPGFVYFLTLPGYGDVFFTKYVYTLTRDPTLNMKIAIGAVAEQVTVSGVCAYTMTIDGSRHLYFKGTWDGTLTMGGGSFGYDLFYDCHKSKA